MNKHNLPSVANFELDIDLVKLREATDKIAQKLGVNPDTFDVWHY